jgi:serine/threonine-protein phosphatase 2A regulatory subunit B'
MKNYDYKDDTKDVRGKTERLNAINELSQMLNDQKNVATLVIPNLDEVMQMIEKNIFRPLPNVKKTNLGFSETGIEQEEEVDPAWPHLQGIYEFFL